MAKNTKEERRELKILLHQAKSIEKTMEQILNKAGKDISFIYSSCNDFVRQYHVLRKKQKNIFIYQEFIILMIQAN